MIAPKESRPNRASEKAAYDGATTRDQGTCVRCRRGGTVQRDHRQNRQAGNTMIANLQCLCPGCHLWKTDHPKDALEQGWACPSWADPREWPAARYLPTMWGVLRLAWVLYDNFGRWVEITDEQARERMEGSAA